MTTIFSRVLAAFLIAGWLATPSARAEAPPPPAETPPPLTTLKARFSYSLGMQIGRDLQKMKDKLNVATFMRGIQDQMEGRQPLLTQEEITQVKEAFQKRMQEEIKRENQLIADKNQKEGKAFLATNKKRNGITTTASGLQYEILTPGKGEHPQDTSTVKVHYKGTLLDGTEFDSSYQRDRPVSFALNRVIAGWREGLQLMTVGAKYRFFIPADLAYGKRGAPPKIGGEATLTFEVELLEIIQ